MSGGSSSVYRVLLRLLPRGFRDAHAEEMEEMLAEHLTDGRWPARIRIWLGAAWDVVRMAVRLRLRRRRDRGTIADWQRRGVGGRTGMGARAGGGERMTTALDGLLNDLRFTLRSLARRPGFTLVALTVLALGIGATTTVVSVANAVLVRPLPYDSAERIGILWHDLGNGAQSLPALNPMDLYDYREWGEAFEAFTLAVGDEGILGGPDDAELVEVGLVEAGFFEFFGTEPVHGRTIVEEDDQPGAAPVAVLSHRLWSRRFGSDPSVLGTDVLLDDESHRIVGIVPEDFRLHLPAEAFLLTDAELWTAARIEPTGLPPRNYTAFTGFARLRPGVSFPDAQEDLDRMESRLRELHPVHQASNLQARIVPLHEDVVKDARPVLLLLFGAVGLVFLVAAINVANLLVARGLGREGELSIRVALGAGRRRVVGTVLMESLVLAVVAGALGAVLAGAGIEAVGVLGSASLPRLDTVTLDASVLVVTAGVSVLAAVIAGIGPAIRVLGLQPVATLIDAGRGGTSRSWARFRHGLILVEVAASVVLLVGAGLMIRSFGALQRVDPGFAVEDRLTFRLSLPNEGYPEDEDQAALYRTLEDRLMGLPGVTDASAVSQLPLTGSGPLMPYAYDEETALNWESVTADRRAVGPGFFRTMGATLLAGREFTARDMASERRLVIVDERLADRAFPAGDAVGRQIQIRPNDAPEPERYAEIIGVVRHLRLHDLARPHLTQIYQPMRGGDRFTVVMRTSGSPGALEPTVRALVEALDPAIPLDELRPMDTLVGAALTPVRVSLVLMTAFGLCALVLAAVGLYGVLAFEVGRHRREIGIRIALGQAPEQVRRLVLVRGMGLVLGAIVVGSLVAVGLGRLASSMLFGVESSDPLTYLTVTGTLAVTALVACWIPARHATRVDPTEALRAE